MFSRSAPACALVLSVTLGACDRGSSGGTSTPTSPTTPSTPAPSPPAGDVTAAGDNWSFRTEGFSGVGITGTLGKGDTLTALEGAFSASGAAITAVLDPFGTCFNADRDRVRLAGTRSGNAVQLVSQPVNGQVVQLTGTLSGANERFEGTYLITGGCGNSRSGRMTGRPVNWTGVWSGTMGAIPSTFDVQMATAPDNDGNYTLSGSAKFTNTQCFANATITRRGRGRVLFPDVVGETQRLELIVEISDDLSTMHIIYVLVTGTCPELSFGDGQLVRR